MQIRNANFLITGANRGIGLAVAKIAASSSANLHIVTRSVDSDLKKQLLSLGAKSVQEWQVDFTKQDQLDHFLKEIESVNIDILFNNAGLLTGGLLERQSSKDINNMFQVNLNAVVLLSRACLPGMLKRRKGKIINNSSVSAFMHFPCASTYAASKAAIVAFTNCLSLELKETGVSTLCLITPGIKTRMFDQIKEKYEQNIQIPTDSISADQYAEKIKAAIESDQEYLYPSGSTAIGLWIAKHMNFLFRRAALNRFHR
ncbi:MAG: SDR family NAD(P)-dependent oxidoreductase [Oligoflexia bacterium]|nr:SDR family NAD(P)-dependent oxidoreductase [Oligoflexia bacterium]